MFLRTVFRLLIIIITGTLLYGVLLYGSGLNEGRHLKKRKKISKWNQNDLQVRIVFFYLFVICVGTILLFLIINAGLDEMR